MNICMCCLVVQGYGLTETYAAGFIVDGKKLLWLYSTEQSTHRDILVSGSNVSPGYWKQPEKTVEDFVIVDEIRYFATGDIGKFRKDGSLCTIVNLRLTIRNDKGNGFGCVSDRKKDLIKMQNGEYILLTKIKMTLLSCPLIDNICCYADSLSLS
uniref:AMP-binding domain-containing protein n=1 Tax=Elaeophora elaphi TaxID=1147741 RepID=A0A0R3RX69_9BILA